ncbi:tetranectin-like protein isoform X2 [Dreissena polymorpha]|uniref:tetranectin-like protein isoform X2 n=1 Tax=Dreissena polymorpha TaxID=45954 RepID=UPI0022650BB6|nr:tetranectin-like protein isoform X2 [Dreissena polymorpha]
MEFFLLPGLLVLVVRYVIGDSCVEQNPFGCQSNHPAICRDELLATLMCPVTCKKCRTSTTTTPTPTCDTSNKYHRLSYDNTRFCIKIHYEPLEWGAARHVCMSEHADLVVLDSHDKYAAMRTHLRNVHIDYRDIWIGASVSNNNRSFYWLNNASLPSNSTKWGRGQPRESVVDNHQHENCVTIQPQDGFKFHDRACFIHFKFICERTL